MYMLPKFKCLRYENVLKKKAILFFSLLENLIHTVDCRIYTKTNGVKMYVK